MKKIFALLLSMAMILAVLPLTSLAQEKYIVGVAFQTVSSDTEIQKDYYTNELAPALGMEFIFSESIKDTETLVTFIENCYAKGAVGIINYYTAGRGRGAEVADQYEMFFITQASKLDDATLDLEYNLGNCGASVDGMARAYTAAMESVLADGENHSVLMCTTAAVGQVAASHYYYTQAMLETMQTKYNLTYSKSIDEIINTDSPGEVETGNPNIKIFLAPGTDNDKTLATISTPLQSGDYDIFVAVSGYANYTSAIAEVERDEVDGSGLGEDLNVRVPLHRPDEGLLDDLARVVGRVEDTVHRVRALAGEVEILVLGTGEVGEVHLEVIDEHLLDHIRALLSEEFHGLRRVDAPARPYYVRHEHLDRVAVAPVHDAALGPVRVGGEYVRPLGDETDPYAHPGSHEGARGTGNARTDDEAFGLLARGSHDYILSMAVRALLASSAMPFGTTTRLSVPPTPMSVSASFVRVIFAMSAQYTSLSGRISTRPALLRAARYTICLLYTSPSPRDRTRSRMPSSA